MSRSGAELVECLVCAQLAQPAPISEGCAKSAACCSALLPLTLCFPPTGQCQFCEPTGLANPADIFHVNTVGPLIMTFDVSASKQALAFGALRVEVRGGRARGCGSPGRGAGVRLPAGAGRRGGGLRPHSCDAALSASLGGTLRCCRGAAREHGPERCTFCSAEIPAPFHRPYSQRPCAVFLRIAALGVSD